jgi:N-acetylglucosaminyl-diphospho-decaprenol L-rhamnosyltransferase
MPVFLTIRPGQVYMHDHHEIAETSRKSILQIVKIIVLRINSAMDLSIIIVNYNAKYFLEQCLHSIDRAVKNIEAEIILVDNHSSDQSLEWIKPRFPKITCIANGENLGFARANNQALAVSRGKQVLFLNPDTIVGEECIRNCLQFAEKQGGLGAIGLRMIDGSGRFLAESKRGLPMPSAAFYKLFGLSSLFPSSTHFNSYYQPAVEEKNIQSIDVLAGAFMMVNRTLLESLGGFDERFFMYGEDIDLCYRIKLKGLRNYYLGNETIIHFKGESTIRDIAHVEQFYKAMEQFLDKHFQDRYSAIQLRLIHSGIRFRKLLAHIFRKRNSSGTGIPSMLNTVLVGDKDSCAKLSLKFSSFELREVEKISAARAIIFCEGEEFPYSRIIEYMQEHPGEKIYRIHSNGSDSIVGSDSKDQRGQSLAW